MASTSAEDGMPRFGSLWVGDLSPDVTEQDLHAFCSDVGPVTSVRVLRDSATGRPLGYGYVNYFNIADAERALDTLNYSRIKGRTCRIMWSKVDSSFRKSDVGNVYVKNLDPKVDHKALHDAFSEFGAIISCKVATDPEGLSRGYGFVHYEEDDAAKTAIERGNGLQIGEKAVEVFMCERRRYSEELEADEFTNLYVKNFPADWGEDTLEELFRPCGSIESCSIKEDRLGRRFAFVSYSTVDSAKKAVEELNRKDLRTEEQRQKDKEEGREEDLEDKDPEEIGYLLYVGRALPKDERRMALREKFGTSEQPGTNVYVRSLPEDTTDESLKELFSSVGTITSAKAIMDDDGKCKGYGFVAFATPHEATKAVTDLHLKVVNGKPLYVNLAENKEARQQRLQQHYSWALTPSAGKGKMGPMMGGRGKGGKALMGGKVGSPRMAYQQKGCQPTGKGVGKGCPWGMMMSKGSPAPATSSTAMMDQGMLGMMAGPQSASHWMPPMPSMTGMVGTGAMPCMGMPGLLGPGVPVPGMMPLDPMMMPTGAFTLQGPGPLQQMQQQHAQQPMPPISAASLAAEPMPVQKQMIGDRLYPTVAKFQPALAGKITGMILELDNSELLLLLESEAAVKLKVEEAIRLLSAHRAG